MLPYQSILVQTLIPTGAPADREEDRMRYSRGNERQGREDAQRERFERWGRWVEEHPDEAATLAESTGWRPQDIPRK